MEDLTDAVTAVDMLRDPLSHDVLGALQGFIHVVDAFLRIHIAAGEAFHIAGVLCHDLGG